MQMILALLRKIDTNADRSRVPTRADAARASLSTIELKHGLGTPAARPRSRRRPTIVAAAGRARRRRRRIGGGLHGMTIAGLGAATGLELFHMDAGFRQHDNEGGVSTQREHAFSGTGAEPIIGTSEKRSPCADAIDAGAGNSEGTWARSVDAQKVVDGV